MWYTDRGDVESMGRVYTRVRVPRRRGTAITCYNRVRQVRTIECVKQMHKTKSGSSHREMRVQPNMNANLQKKVCVFHLIRICWLF